MQFLSYDGVNFASQGIIIKGAESLFQRTSQGIYVSGAQTLPKFAGVQFDTVVIPTFLEFHNWDNLQSDLRTLDRILRWDRIYQRTLVAQLDDGTQIEILAIPKALNENGWVRYELLWEVTDYWESSVSNTVSVTGPTSAGNSLSASATVSGTVRALPKVTLHPQMQKTSGTAVHTLAMSVTEQDGVALDGVTWEIPFDHASQVSAGNSTSAGTDIRVFVDGIEVDRRITDADTSSTRVVFPLTVAANGTAIVQITYAGSGQTYGGNAYAEDAYRALVTERAGGTDANYSQIVTFDHASYVSAGHSKSSGADIRVWVDGVEVDRVIYGANTSTCNVWFPISLTTGGTATVVITMASSGYDYAGSGYSLATADLANSTATQLQYTTPAISNGDDTPFVLRPILTKIDGSQSNPTNYQIKTATVSDLINSDPGWVAEIMDVPSPANNGNYLRFYAGGPTITGVHYRVPEYQNSKYGAAFLSQCKTGYSTDGATYTQLAALTQSTGQTNGSNPSTVSMPASTKAFIIGIERAYTTQQSGTSETNQIGFSGRSTDYVYMNLDSTTVPLVAGMTDPVNAAGGSTFAYQFDGVLSDELGHSIAVQDVTAPVTWARNIGSLIDSDLSSWTPTGASITSGVADGDGGTNAYTLVEDSSTGQHDVNDNDVSVTDGQLYTIRVRAKANGRSILTINIVDHPFTGGIYARFDLSSGTIDTAATTYDVSVFTDGMASIEAGAESGEYACLLIFRPSGTNAVDLSFELYASSNSYAGDGSSGIDLYDAELIKGTGAVGALVIDAATKTAWLVDRGGTEVANSALSARKGLKMSGDDEDWLSADPNGTRTLTWTESFMDADGMRLTIEIPDQWR